MTRTLSHFELRTFVILSEFIERRDRGIRQLLSVDPLSPSDRGLTETRGRRVLRSMRSVAVTQNDESLALREGGAT